MSDLPDSELANAIRGQLRRMSQASDAEVLALQRQYVFDTPLPTTPADRIDWLLAGLAELVELSRSAKRVDPVDEQIAITRMWHQHAINRRCQPDWDDIARQLADEDE